MLPVYFLIPAMLLSLLLLKLNQHYASPVLAMVNRWVRWGVMAGGIAQMFIHFGWSQRPFGVLFIVFLVVWFLLDGIYRWITIHAMSVSPLPLFPRFALNHAGDEWPVQGRFLKLRDELRAGGFKQVQSLRAEVATSLFLRMSIYQSTDLLTRLQIAFIPQPLGNVTVCLHFSSATSDGRRVVTDNHYLPFAGFYPENWLIERSPRMRSFARLFARHRDRVAEVGAATVPWTTEPLEDLNDQQAEIERINMDLGFLLPTPEHEEHGRISQEGRFRVWKEMLTLNYLGRAASYE